MASNWRGRGRGRGSFAWGRPGHRGGQPGRAHLSHVQKPAATGGGHVVDRDTLKITISLNKQCEFVAVNKYNTAANEIFKECGGRFDKAAIQNQSGWIFKSPDQYQKLLERLNSTTSVKVAVDGVPACVLEEMKRGTWQTVDMLDMTPDVEQTYAFLLGRIDKALIEKLMPYQRAGIACAVRRHGRVLWCDEMGLGKTVQALVAASFYRDEWPMLIVCPSSLKKTWAKEVERWLGFDSDLVRVLDKGSDPVEGAVCIVSYDLLRNIKDKLPADKFKVIIADEAHYIKNGKASRTAILVPLLQRAKRAFLLTGTPALSKPIELFQQIRAIKKNWFKSEIKFGLRYCNSYHSDYGWRHEGSDNEEELHTLLVRSIMIRREKKLVLKELPPKVRQTVFVDGEAKVMREIKQLQRQKVGLESKRGGGGNAAMDDKIRGVTLQLYRMSGQAKLKGGLAYLDDALEKGLKFLVFAHHQDVLDAVTHHFTKKKVRHIRIDGSTQSAIRQQLCDRFQKDEQCKAAILSITAAGTGLTLHAANFVVFLELYWNPGQLLQAEDRVHRVGQANSVDVKYVICPGTLDDDMWTKVQKKMSVVGKTIKGKVDKLDTATATDDRTDRGRQQKLTSILSFIGHVAEPTKQVVDGNSASAASPDGACLSGGGGFLASSTSRTDDCWAPPAKIAKTDNDPVPPSYGTAAAAAPTKAEQLLQPASSATGVDEASSHDVARSGMQTCPVCSAEILGDPDHLAQCLEMAAADFDDDDEDENL